MTSPATAIEVVDQVHRLKSKPGGWWITAAGCASFALVVWGGWKLSTIDERTTRVEAAVTRIETAMINRGAMADRRPLTDDDHDARARVAGVRSFRLLDDASADGAAEAAAPDRVR